MLARDGSGSLGVRVGPSAEVESGGLRQADRLARDAKSSEHVVKLHVLGDTSSRTPCQAPPAEAVEVQVIRPIGACRWFVSSQRASILRNASGGRPTRHHEL